MKKGSIFSALVLAGGLTTGAIWHGVAADTQAAAPQTVTATVPTRIAGGGRDSYADVVKDVTPAVVTIRVEGRARVSPTQFQDDDLFRRFFGDQFGTSPRRMPAPRTRGLGSGVVVTSDGYLLTNHHVIDGASDIRVEFADGRSFAAKVVGSDQPSDLALLKIDATNLHPLTLGDSDAVQVGDIVLAVGNPLGIGQTVTSGIVSAKGRSTGVGDGGYEDFLQTDAPINHGNSGGALVNTKGELVGINSQILSVSDGNIGIGFAIPANMARRVMDQLKTDGRVHRAQLGVSVQPVTSDLAASLGLSDTRGAIVSAVEPGSAAERAGVKRGDVIVSFNGQPVSEYNALRNRVAEAKPGASATVGIVRDGSEKTLTVKLDEASPNRTARGSSNDAPESADQTALGVAVAPLTPEAAARAGIRGNVKGLLVQNVEPDSRAADAGIRPGDVIVEANRKSVTSVDELRAAVRGTPDRPLLLLVNREGHDLFLTVRPSSYNRAMDQRDLQTLLDYHYWARDRVLDAAETLTPEQFTRDLGSSFKSVRDTLVHTYSAEWAWHSRWRGVSPTSLLKADDYPDVQTVRAHWSDLEKNVRGFLADLSEAGITRVIEYKLLSGQPGASPFWQMLQHMVNHASYHRGQVTTMLRQLGAAPAKSMDMIGFFRERAAALEARS